MCVPLSKVNAVESEIKHRNNFEWNRIPHK